MNVLYKHQKFTLVAEFDQFSKYTNVAIAPLDLICVDSENPIFTIQENL